jgi:hypothetical protein
LAFEPAINPAVAGDLSSILQALPVCLMRRGTSFPQWWMLLAADRYPYYLHIELSIVR